MVPVDDADSVGLAVREVPGQVASDSGPGMSNMPEFKRPTEARPGPKDWAHPDYA